MTEIGQASEALKDVTGCDKLNVAALGNQVPQLHIHIIARRRDYAVASPGLGRWCPRSNTMRQRLRHSSVPSARKM